MSGSVVKRLPPIETWGGETNGWRVCLSMSDLSFVLYLTLVMRRWVGYDACAWMLFAYRTWQGRAGLDSYSQTPPWWSLATSWLATVQSSAASGRRYVATILHVCNIATAIFPHTAQVFHAALLGLWW